MKSCLNSIFFIFCSLFVSSLFTAEMMSPHASLLFYLAENKQWDRIQIELMNKCIPKRPDGEDFTQGGLTLLHLAINDNQIDVVDMLIKRQARVVTPRRLDKNSEIIGTPLHFAAALGHISIGKLLIEADKDSINSTNCKFNNTPLHLAAWFDQPKMIKFLLKNGANIEATNSEGSTPIHSAVWQKNKTCVKKLLAHEDPATLISAITMNNGQGSPLALAKLQEFDSIEKILLLYLHSQLNAAQFIDYIMNHKKFDQSQTVLIMGNTMERPSILN